MTRGQIMTNKNKKAVTTCNSNGSDKSSSESRHANNSALTVWDAIEAFRDTLQDNGLGRPEIKPDTGIQRFKIEGDRRNNKSGWYNFHTDGNIPAGAFGNWRTGLNQTFYFKKDNKPLTDAERNELAKVYANAKKKREAETQKKYAEARRISNGVWNKGIPANPDHPYLVKKGSQSASKYLRMDTKGNLLVPLYNKKRLVSLQYINKHGGKFFVKGSELKGSFFMFGSLKKSFNEIFICEGISTGWTVHTLADQAPIFCALTAGNLKNVALSVRNHYPAIKIIIAGDQDYRTDGSINIGVEKAKEAAQAVGGYYSIPSFPNPETAGDWNDLYLSCCAQQKAGANNE